MDVVGGKQITRRHATFLDAPHIQNRAACRGMPRVEYTLTERGKSVIPILQDICKWAGIFTREVSEDAPAHCKTCNFHAETE